MNFTEINIKFIEYDGSSISKPPIFEPGYHPYPPSPYKHDLDGQHNFLMVIPKGFAHPLDMAYMLCWLEAECRFEWISRFFAKKLWDDEGCVPLDKNGHISFPLQKGDRWALWPQLSRSKG